MNDISILDMQRIAAGKRIKEKKYWLNALAGDITKTGFPYDYQVLNSNERTFETITCTLAQENFLLLSKLSGDSDIRLHIVLTAGLVALLHKYTGSTDIILGMPIYRQDVKGEYINKALVLRNRFYETATSRELLNVVRTTIVEAVEHQDYPIEILAEELIPSAGDGDFPLFDCVIMLENIHDKSYIQNIPLDMIFSFVRDNGHIGLTLAYNPLRYKKETVQLITVYLERLFSAALASLALPLPELEILTKEEKENLIFAFNNTAVEFPAAKTIAELFAEQVKLHSNRPAVSSNLDLSSFFADFEPGKIDLSLRQKFENCCFKKNPYVFKFKGSAFLEAIGIFTGTENKELTVLRTHKLNYIAVNKAVLSLMDCFDGKANIRSIFHEIAKSEDLRFLLYTIRKEKEEAGFTPGSIERMVIGKNFAQMVLLVKALLRAHLIDLAGCNPVDMEVIMPLPVEGGEEAQARNVENENPNGYRSGGTIKSPVLLLGDRTGPASTGLLYIASFLRRNGIEAYCQWNDIQVDNESLKANINKLLAEIRPQIVGVSMKWFPHIARVLEICRLVKEFDPGITIAVGGNTASYYKEKIIQFDCVDFVIVGDGEEPFLKLCLGETPVPNCVYKEGETIIETPQSYVQNESNSSDIYFSHLDQVFVSSPDPYLASDFFICTGKGCSMQCFYCGGCRTAQEKTFKRKKPFMRGAEEVRKDIIAASPYTSTFFFDFDLPAYQSLEYYKTIWDGLNISQHFCEFYFWQLPSFEFLDYVVKTFTYIYINIDLCSLSEPHRLKLSSLGIVKPQPTDEELFLFFKRCRQYDNIEIIVNQITGLPHFTREDITHSHQALTKILSRYANVSAMDWGRLHAQPGAPIVDSYKQFNMRCYATTFEDFLHYSQLNMKEDIYPVLLTFNYPYIYSEDDDLNSKISKYYLDSTRQIAKYKEENEKNLSVVFDLSYSQLAERSDRLARLLRSKGVGDGVVVGVMVKRSMEMIVTMLAIIKAGGAYLPIDYNYPAQRIKYMLSDSKAALLLVDEVFTGECAEISFAGEVIDINNEFSYPFSDTSLPVENNDRCKSVLSSKSLAYIIYTSGSTGKPKGVMVEHCNVARLVKQCNYMNLDPGKRLLLTGNYVFDIATFEIWGSLLNGLNLFLADQEVILDGEKLKKFLWKNEINILHLVPQVFNLLASAPGGYEIFSGLEYFLVGGDLVSPRYINELRIHNEQLKILHMYGPTENTTFSTFFPVEKEYKNTIPLGKPIGNSTVYILNKNNRVQPIGIPGEICVGGAGITRGYLNNPELTAEKFSTFLKESDAIPSVTKNRLYRTGDLGKWNREGNIEFLGREDHQVKIRGFRIELGEIETQLLKHESVKEALVLHREKGSGASGGGDQDIFLCAYIVLRDAGTPDRRTLRPVLKEYLAQRLPDYMIPDFVFLDQFPLTHNGKLDKRALPDPELIPGEEYIAPRDIIEEKLVAIWSDVLDRTSPGSVKIGIDDNFFDLGGHSLKATILASKIHKVFDVKIQLVEIFKMPKIRELANYIKEKNKEIFVSIEPAEKKEYYLLSSAQKRLYVLQRMNPEIISYNIPEIIPLPVESDLQKIEETFRKLIKRHESLRTSFHMINDTPVQVVHDHVAFKADLFDLKDTQNPRDYITRFISPFDLTQAPLIRTGLLKEAGKRCILIVDMHHVISDGSSHEILLNDFLTLYQGKDLPPLPVQYKDFSEWQNGEKETENLKRQEEYWLKEFAGEIPVLELPIDFPRPVEQSFEGNIVEFEISAAETRALNTMAITGGATLFMVLVAVLNVLLAKLSNQEDIVIGTPIAGRRHADLEKIIGMFVNTLALRNYPSGEITFAELVEDVAGRMLMVYENQEYPFEELVEKLSVRRDIGRNPLFDIMFGLQNINTGHTNRDKNPPIEVSPSNQPGFSKEKEYENLFQAVKFDLELYALEKGHRLSVSLHYCTKLFKKETVERFIIYFKKIVSIAVKYPGIRISQIEIIPAEEKKRLLNEFNDTRVDFPTDKTIQQLVEEQAKIVPDHIALVGPLLTGHDIRLSYRELDEQSHLMAHLLKKMGVNAEAIVGLMLERSIEMVIGIIGVWKAGGVYLPIDPQYPPERIDYILKDSGTKIVLTAEVIANILSTGNRHLATDPAPISATGNLRRNFPLSTDLAYIIYTSGSTGKPKGAMLEHIGMINHIWAKINDLQISKNSIVAQNASHTFDISVWQFFAALLQGGTTVIYANEVVLNPNTFISRLINDKISILEVVPSYLSLILNLLREKNFSLLHLEYLLVTGEEVKRYLVKQWFELYPGIRMVNAYGPTEASDDITHHIMDGVPHLERVPIGKPVQNMNIYIVDRNMQLCPLGVKGEIWVSGIGVGRGYLNDWGKTSRVFMTDPFSKNEGVRLYKTGDIGRRLPDGAIEFFGRTDYQVKIRGFRIEIGEIENRILNHPGIKEVVVIDREEDNGNKYLSAYIVSDKEYEARELREHLAKDLPAYMIPSFFVQMETLPLTPNGKIDRKALPKPDGISLKEDIGHQLPTTAVEKTLVEIWEKVLGRKNIGINENFFMIGGDSIKSIQIIARMGSAGYKIDMKDLFQYPVIVDLAPRVKKLKRIPDQFAITGTIPLTPIQADFFHKSHFEPHHYNQAVMLYSQGFDKEALNIVFSKITAHHDTLRLTFKRNPRSGEIVQFNHDLNYPFSMAEFDLKNIENSIEELHEKVNQVQASIDLETGPLMKLALFHLDDGDRLLIVIHHLAIDGISWRILFEDIETLYGQYNRGEKLVLPPKTDSYKRWAEQLTQYANSKNFLKEKSYWQKIASGEVPSIPGDFPIAENLNKDFTGTSFTLNEKETERLLTKANEAFGTEIIDLLLTAFGMAMKKTFDRDRIAITLEGHGREQILADIDISRTVGWFTAEYPVLFDISYPGEPGRQVKEIKETLRRIPNKGTGFGILKYLTAEANKNEIEFKVNPQIIFNYLGQFDADINQKSFFEIAKESPGNSQGPNGKREYVLDVSGMTANKCLVMSISYNKTHFNRETMIELIGKFESELIHLIAFCCAKENRELTPSDFTYKELPVETVDSLVNVYTGIDDIYTLTPMQQGILFHSLVDKSSFSYFEQVSYRLHGNLDISITEKSLNDLFKRHDILRTAFVSNDIERPVQIVLRDRTVDFYYEDMSHLEKIEEKEILISEFKYKDKIRSFDLSKNVLMRVAILRIADFVYEFTWSFHHILMDGWCIGILNNEFFEIYRSYIENRANRLPGVKPYRTYIQWLERQDNEGAARYWENYLDSFAEQTGVPAFRATRSKDGNTYRNETVSVVLDMDKTAALKKLAAGNQVTLNTLTQTMWGILLGKYNEKEDVVFGAVVSGRPSELDGVESMVGLFINTIPVRIHFGEDMNFYRLLQIVQEEALLSEPYHYHPLAEIQATAVLKQNLIDHIMVFENYPITEQIEGSGREKNKNNEIVLQLANIEVFEQTNYNFNIVLGGAECLLIKFQYNGNVYDRYFVERMAAHFSRIVDQVIANLELKINQLILLSEEEKNRILYEFNNTEAAYPKTKTIHRLFEEQAGQNPDSIAVIGKRSMAEEFRDNVYTQVAKNFDIRITYKELNDKANRLASRLIEKGVQPDFIVGIMVERSLEMIIGILGILKAGGVYLPIDPEYPKERSDFMLKDSGAKILLTGEDLAAGLFINGKTSPIQTHSHHAAYIIYTSGTTGRPKGVIIEHSNVVRLFFNSHCLYDFNRGDVWTMFHSYCFDFSVWEMYGALLFGGKSVIIPKIVSQDPAAFINVLQKQRVTILNQTPSAFYSLIDEELKHIRPALNLRYIIFGGEALTPIKLKEWRQRYPGTRLINMFGITETTVHVTYKEITEKEIDINISCIGSPIPTLSTYLFDPGLKLSPIGIPGELCVGGEGVARGYLNRPELTYQKFIENPFKKGEKLYKSGDLARLSYDGEMEYLGRIDQQIQVRGFRVELGEIESRLLKFPGIKETVVLALDEKGDKYLCAYIVSDREYGRSELRKHLSNELPDYMMPSYFVRLEKIPLTPSGKVDRRALPVPYLKAGESYSAPGNEIETKLVELWAGILGRDELHASQLQTSIGIDDNFFELGGHSLKVTILVSRIHKVFDVKVPLTEIFKRPKIRELANYIKEKRKEYYISIEPVEKQEYYRLSSAQKRLYILQQIGLNGVAYNLPEIIPLPAASDWKKIAETFKKLIQRHEGLRTSFHMIDDTPVQVIHDRVEFGISLLDSNRSHDSQGNIKQFIRPFDLSIAPLIRVGLINEEDKRRFLIIDMHHIISDGVSHQVLVKDFFSIYNEETIPPLRVQYKDFAEWQNGENEAENLIRQESYWLKEFAGEIPALELPTDFPRPEAQSFEGDIVDFAISAEETRALDAMALNRGATLFMVLVAVVNILFSKLSSQEDIVIGTPIAGRRHADLDKIIGMFVNTLSLRNNPSGDRTFRDFLGEVKEKTLAAFENQEYPFEELVDKLSVKRDMGRNPLFDVMFALQNMNTGLADRDKEAGFETHRPDPFESLKEYGSIFQSSKFDLTLNVIEKGAVLFLSFEYCTKLFKKETVERFIIYFKKIVSTVVTNPLVRISEIGIITEEEKKRILHDFNETNVEYPRDKTIHLLFEEQVKRTPDYIALIDSYLQVSYRELDKKSGVLAHVLQSKGTGSDTIVGIMMERSVEMIAAILGILKSGGAYLPIDPDYPLERVNYMLRDSAAGILINKSPFEAQSTKFETNSNETNPNDPNKNRNFVIPFVLNFETLNFEFDSCCECRASDLVPSNLAYVIYTSGSTGNPKGVLVAHRNVIRLVNNTDYIQFKDRDRILQTGALSFDASTFEIWGALLNGMSLVLFPKEQILNPVALKHILRQLDISTIWMTAPLFNQMADEDEEIFARLRNLLVGGDILSPVHINRVRKKNPGLKIINGYGPTENTTFSTTYSIESDYDRNIPIGRPISNSTAYILDKNMNVQPIGVWGELYVGGDGVSRGYLNCPELTAEKYIRTANTLYRTGDLSRWLPDGNIEFIGRIDHQVKIRGFRIEPGEIESRLMKYKEIKEAVVTAASYENGNRYLCAYISASRDFQVSELRRYLEGRIPGYMIPSKFVLLEEFPLTNNGKIDREKLNSLGKKLNTGGEYVAPKSDNQIAIAEAWKKILELDQVGIYDNFFDLGGTSLDMIRLNHKLKEIFKRDIPIIAMYRYTTVDSFSHFLGDGNTGVEDSPISPRYKEHVDKMKKGIAGKNKRREIASEIRSRRRK